MFQTQSLDELTRSELPDLHTRAVTRTSPNVARIQRDQLDRRVELSEVVGVGGDNRMTAAVCADHDVRIHDVGCIARSEKAANVRSVDTIERHDLCRRRAHQPRQAYLSLGSADSLSERGSRNSDRGARLRSAGK